MVTANVSRYVAASRLLRASSAAFDSFLSTLPAEVATSAAPGCWSPAAHAFHAALTLEVFDGIIAGTAPLKAFEGSSDFPDKQWSFVAVPLATAPSILVPPLDTTAAAACSRLRDAAARLATSIEASAPALGSSCVRLPWGVVSIVQMCEWGAGHTLRHLAQSARELHLSAAPGS